MYNALVEAVSRALYDAFPDVPILGSEEIEQGIQEPCFLITVVSPAREKVMQSLYQYRVALAVQYFPEDKERPREECQRVLAELDDTLECVEVQTEEYEKLTWREKMDAAMVDDVLTATVVYTDVYYRPEDNVSMEHLDEIIREKGQEDA